MGRGRSKSLNWYTLLPVDCSANGVTLKRSRFGIPHIERGMLAAQLIEKGGIVGFYYGTLVYEHKTRSLQRNRTYVESVMAVTKERF